MTAFDARVGNSLPPSTQSSGAASLSATPAPKPLTDVQPQAMPPQLDALLAALDDSGGSAPDAPALPPPVMPLTPDMLATELGAMLRRLGQARANTAKQGITLSDTQRQEAHQRAVDNISEMATKLKAASKKGDVLKILGIIGKVLAVVGAAVATVMTAGAAAPIAGVLLVYAVTDTALSIADLYRPPGSSPISLDALMGQGFTKLGEKCGMTPEHAQQFGQWATFAVQAAIALATLACGVVAIRSAVSGSQALLKMGGTGFKVAGIMQSGSQIANGAVLATKGGVTISQGYDRRDADQARSDKAQWDKATMLLTQQVQDGLDQFKRIVDGMNDAMRFTSDTLSANADTELEITRNIV